MNRQTVMADPSVHKLTRDVLSLTKGKDVLDRYYDVKLALMVLEKEMNKALGK